VSPVVVEATEDRGSPVAGFVLDCSVAASWAFEDEGDDSSEAVLDLLAEEEALVPALFPYELANVLVVGERRDRLSERQAAGFLEILGTLGLRVEPPTSPERLLDVARRHGLSAYDAGYLELALRTGLPLATRDGPLRDAAGRAGVRLLEEEREAEVSEEPGEEPGGLGEDAPAGQGSRDQRAKRPVLRPRRAAGDAVAAGDGDPVVHGLDELRRAVAEDDADGREVAEGRDDVRGVVGVQVGDGEGHRP